jgi:hypothetical protein
MRMRMRMMKLRRRRRRILMARRQKKKFELWDNYNILAATRHSMKKKRM